MSTRKKATPPKPSGAESSRPKAPAAQGMLGLEEIKALIALVGKEPFQEFEFEAGNMRFRIRKESLHAPAPQVSYAPVAPAPAFGAPVSHMLAAAAPMQTQELPIMSPAAPAAPVEEPGIHYITSPIVGTFYRASNPNSPAFVQVGDLVRPGQTLCIVEAMKLMNEIEAEIGGTIVEILVENAQAVQFGQPLFKIRPG